MPTGLRSVTPYSGAARPQGASPYALRIVAGPDGWPVYATGAGASDGEFALDGDGSLRIVAYTGDGLRARSPDGTQFTIYGET